MTYRATDSHGASGSTTFTITVNAPVPQPPVYNGGIPYNVALTPTRRSYTFPADAFSSPAGEALTYTVSGLPSYMSFYGPGRTFTATTLPPGGGEFTPNVTLIATDTGGHSVSHVVSFDIIGGGGGIRAVPADGGLDAQAAPQATPVPNIQSYWFTYDADNWVEVSGGALVGSQIQIDDRAGSQSQTYDLAGDVIKTLTTDGTATFTQTSRYDARGEMIHSVLPGIDTDRAGMTETRQYDDDGRLIADVYAYAPGTVIHYSSTDVPNGTMPIGGWLATATTYYYDADGRVTATYDYGRVGVDQAYWNNLGREFEAGTLDLSEQTTIPSLPSADAAAGGAAYVDGVLRTYP